MNAVDLIRKKRNGLALTEAELQWLIQSYVEGGVPDYQMSAFLMACYFRGMSMEETLTFTRLMVHSGEVIDLTEIPGVKVDKHSTGGVGDKVSLILAPIVAACGVPVPMISGRGLGHTGGTLDKLESIPGFRTNLTVAEFKNIIREINVVMIGQTREITPADKKMYALRDVTATIECYPLIAGSILSKKIAEGIDALVLDIKCGRGAFMQSDDQALGLAELLVQVGGNFGKETIAFISDMNQPLGIAIGNWLEVVESVECLRGTRGAEDGSKDLMEVTYVLSGAMLMLGRKAGSIEEGIAIAKQAIKDGSAYTKFLQLVHAQNGDTHAIENLERYPISNHVLEVRAEEGGYVTAIDSLELGLTSITLGAGRLRVDDRIDPKAGIVLKQKVGDRVNDYEPLALFYTDREDVLERAKERIKKAFSIGVVQSPPSPLISALVTKQGVQKWKL
ncbi:MAG: thymidine phosphorylase [bacterium]